MGKSTFALILFFIFLLITACQEIIYEREEIENTKLSFSINDNSGTAELYHVYFRNIDDKKKSIAFNIFDITDKVEASLFPGKYNIYAYGLVEKTSTSKKVFSYSIMNEYECFNDKDIKINLDVLEPSIDVIIDNIGANHYLSVNMANLKECFSLSSISLKQGSDRVRSLNYSYDENSNSYIAPVVLYQNGDWFLNISYLLKSSKRDDNKLDEDGIYISTSYFKSIYLGEFNLL